ncbi:gp53-like domain-containing protein [Yersinia kristensenii]|uniref:gp53-like domain-containing protein n=1 Tax=Yersinia kristensenii TaxID=28152 RepID=UPI0001A54283|nr:hypothetical protein [Yersinia kristensenii]EEP89192.1 hypothetical protein ykris0001_2530 [Yersinia kristensenii ATCC 33638]PEH52740.1 hypothetical protein CRM81_04880 [Yersinia kristensenii]SUP70594.1 phage lambda-related protein [Yersinia kristensenii]SUQ39281.1 phage lambda-related protein [Yersinia kristensenii]
MPKNEFKAFAIGKNANVLTQAEFDELIAVINGFQSGIARSEQLNKVWRQSSVISHVVAEFMAENSGDDILDDGNLDKLKVSLVTALFNNAKAQLDERYLNIIKNLSDLSNKAEARRNLDIYSRGEVNETFLQKEQNGADIPDKPRFVDNLDLRETVNLAVGALQKNQNGADIPDPALFVKNLRLGKFQQAADATRIFSPNDDTYLRIDNTGWYFANKNTGKIPASIDAGGTGATTAEEAIKKLGIDVLLSDKQKLSQNLTALSALVASANKLPYFTSNKAAGLVDLTQVGKNLLSSESLTALISYLGFSGDANHIKFPTGHIIQWGTWTIPSNNASVVITLPHAYSEGNYWSGAIFNSAQGASPDNVYVPSAVLTSIRITHYGDSAASGAKALWLSIGK